ncbi:hypothetical protein PG984_016086 [Apiospora sp. TS-2023a]
MFETRTDNKFESSDKYFFAIELLRISAEWVKEKGSDLKNAQESINRVLLTHIKTAKDMYKGEHPNAASWDACANVISHNWGIVFLAYQKYEKDLQDRIERKTQEVKSLRDGLFSATSVREATKGTSINEYILVFTVMTIVYLPLGFVAALYGIDMFDFEIPGQTKSFAITTAVVSSSTYLAAWVLLHEVRQRRKSGSYRKRLSGLMDLGWSIFALNTPLMIYRSAVRTLRATYKGHQRICKSSKPTAEASEELEVGMDEEIPSEVLVNKGKVKNKNKRVDDQHSRWKVITGWVTRRRQIQGVEERQDMEREA